MSVSADQVREALEGVKFPGLDRDIVSYGFVESIEIDGSIVHLKLNLPSGKRSAVEQIAKEAHAAASAVDGVEVVKLEVSAPRAEGAGGGGGEGGDLGMARKGGAAPGGPPRGPGGGPPGGPGGTPGPTVDRTPIPGVKQMIAVASGKGGVGKSTVAVNLAAGLAELGEKVGLMDADIYGPSVPTMLGTHEEPRLDEIDGKRMIVPVEKFGMRLMSLGFIQQGDDAVIWRGPLVMKAVQQFLRDVDWRECEVLVIDLPPGTGDAQLTLTQTAPLTGAVIVTTPQDVALIDARKGLKMFNTVDVPVLGIVENMSFFRCPECGHESHIFKSGGGERTARELGVPFLGGIPIDPLVAESGDEGTPIVTSHPDSEVARAFLRLAETVRKEWPERETEEADAAASEEEQETSSRSGMAAALDRIRGK